MIGIDVVHIERLRATLDRDPELKQRLFTGGELAHSDRKPDPVRSLAGMLAAKEAAMKAAGLRSLPAWARRIEITHDRHGAPFAIVSGTELDVRVSISHDGVTAVAAAVLAGGTTTAPPMMGEAASEVPALRSG
jgi:phosphopantetheine--protein transferase-like protein